MTLQKGFGQMEEGCLPCDCDDQGSVGDQCDPYTGQCVCKTGVTGLQCKTCKEGFYGFSYRGCIGMSFHQNILSEIIYTISLKTFF